MTTKRISFIVNPNAAMGSTGKEWPSIKHLARRQLGPFQSFITNCPGDATNLTRNALKAGSEIIVCVGGDGTLNEVINGFMDKHEPIRPESLLAFIPRGTGCDFIRTFPLPFNIQGLLKIIANGHSRKIDLGRLEYVDHKGDKSFRFFHNVVSFGLGGEVDERVNRTTKVFGGFISFMWATLISFLIYNKKQIHIKVDNGFEKQFTSWNIAVANGQYHGGGMRIAPGAKINDGLLNVTVIGNFTLPEIFINLPKLYNGKIYQLKKVNAFTCKQLDAHSEEHVLLDVDGEQPGYLPVHIDILPHALSIIC
ncbi:MAG: diacylglycerol kinase family lipid kinase [Deltaproteobacteria bacterium]|nr:diacylglycerol kinase family lipid kinase [Deltaproteobacteria bacterium]